MLGVLRGSLNPLTLTLPSKVAAFTVASVPGVVLWLPGSALEGSLSNGASVTSWAGGINSAAPSSLTAPVPPIWTTNQVNGRGAAVSSNTGDLVFTTATPLSGDFVIYAVVNLVGTEQCVPIAANDSYTAFFTRYSNGTSGESINGWSDGYGTATLTPYGYTRVGPTLMKFSRSGTSYTGLATGGHTQTNDPGGTVPTIHFARTMKKFNVSGGRIAELIVVNQAVSSSDNTAILSYLNNYFGVGLS